MDQPFGRLALLVICASSWGCSAGAYRVAIVPRTTALVRDALDLESERALRSTLDAEGIHGLERWHHTQVIDTLAARFDGDPCTDRALALAELCLREADRGPLGPGPRALHWLRDAAVYASFAQSPATIDRARQIHNQAVEAIVRVTAIDRPSSPGAWQIPLAAAGIEVRSESAMGDPARLQTVDLTDNYLITGFFRRYRGEGIGVPVIGQWCNQEGRVHLEIPAYVAKVALAPGTLVLRPMAPALGGAWRSVPVTLTIYDSQQTSCVAWSGCPLPLAYDRTTGYALIAARSRQIGSIATIGVLQSSLRSVETGIYTHRPYSPGKIPVVLVHGLAGSPATWLIDVNELMNDPEIAPYYQFWAYFYPTGQPIPVDAMELRQAIRQARRDFDPAGQDPAFDRMVLIGHSLGGILSRMMTLESGQAVWDSTIGVPSSQFHASAETETLVRESLIFHPEPSVARTVYIAAPHQGSPVASGPWGSLLTLLARPNPELEAMRNEVIARYGPQIMRAPAFQSGFVIQNLQHESPLLQAIARLPDNPNVPYHSIILHRAFRDSDGLVPYWSAHLDGAESELYVRTRHTKHEVPEVIAELKRILVVHRQVSPVRAPRVSPPGAVSALSSFGGAEARGLAPDAQR
jgi:pimeloyl-ACP methyl ester carboxylesterase